MRMPRRFVDLSVALENDVPADPPLVNNPKIAYIEKIELTTYNGTHLDAPYHFASTMDNGARSQLMK